MGGDHWRERCPGALPADKAEDQASQKIILKKVCINNFVTTLFCLGILVEEQFSCAITENKFQNIGRAEHANT